MKKIPIYVLLSGAILLMAACGLGGPDSPGFLSEYPGGIINLDLYYAGTETTNLIIAFDEDTSITSGNELLVVLPVGQFLQYDEFDSPFIYQSFTWYAPDIPQGAYYVYAWLDFDGEGDLDAVWEEEDSVTIYSPNDDFSFDNVNYEILSTQGLLSPNYEFWTDYAPDIILNMYANLG